LRYFSLKEKIFQSLRASIWSIGFFSGLVAIIALIPQFTQDIPVPVRIAFIVTTTLWLCSYQIGAFLNGRYLPLKRRIWFHFLVLTASFFLGIIESVTPLLALLTRPKTFEVVKK